MQEKKDQPDQNNNPPEPELITPAADNTASSLQAAQNYGVNEAKAMVDEGVSTVSPDFPQFVPKADEFEAVGSPIIPQPPSTPTPSPLLDAVEATENQPSSSADNTNNSSSESLASSSLVVPSAESALASSQPTSNAPPAIITGNIDGSEAQPASLSNRNSFFRHKFKLASLIVIGLIFLLGAAGFAYINYGPHSSEKAVAKAVGNIFDEQYFEAVKLNLNIKEKSTSYSIYAIAGQKDGVYRSDFSFKYSLFNLEGSGIYNQKDNTTYIKVNGLNELANAFGMPADQSDFDKWIKISANQQNEVLQGSSPTAPTAQASQKCIEGMYNFAKTNEFKKELLSLYSTNKFAVIEKVGSEEIDSQKTSKYSAEIDNQKMDNFGDSVAASKKINDKLKTIDKSCNLDSSNQNSETATPITKTSLRNVYLWVNSKKQLKQISAEIISGDTTTSVQLNMLEKSKLDYTIPTDTVDGLEELLAPLGSSQSSLGL